MVVTRLGRAMSPATSAKLTRSPHRFVAEQLERLPAVGARPWVQLQVLSLDAPRATLIGSSPALASRPPGRYRLGVLQDMKGGAARQEGQAKVQPTRSLFDLLGSAAMLLRESADLIKALLNHSVDRNRCWEDVKCPGPGIGAPGSWKAIVYLPD